VDLALPDEMTPGERVWLRSPVPFHEDRQPPNGGSGDPFMRVSAQDLNRTYRTDGATPMVQRAPSGAVSQGAGRDAAEVSLSFAALDASTARRAAEEQSGVRTDLVQSIRDRLEAGSYRVPASDVADSMIRTLQDLRAA